MVLGSKTVAAMLWLNVVVMSDSFALENKLVVASSSVLVLEVETLNVSETVDQVPVSPMVVIGGSSEGLDESDSEVESVSEEDEVNE